jgi:hypothetical protein
MVVGKSVASQLSTQGNAQQPHPGLNRITSP